MLSEWRTFFEGRTTLSDMGTGIIPASLNPPILPAAPVAGTSSGGSPGWFMLDKALYIGHHKNGTFAQAITRTGPAVGVSLWLTDPPAPSHMCFHLSGLKVADLVDEPPSLDVLPHRKPCQCIFHHSDIGFFPCGDGEEHFVLAHLLLQDEYMGDENGDAGATVSRVYKDDCLVHDNDRVLTFEGGLLGWVDLWRGILVDLQRSGHRSCRALHPISHAIGA